MNARILIITNGALCRNPRPLKEAVTLENAGYEVTILTVRNHRAAEALDAELLRAAPFRREVVDLLPGNAAARPAVFLRRLRTWAARQATARLRWSTVHALGPAAALLRRASKLPADLTIVHNEVPHWVGLRLLQAGRRVAADIEDWHSEDLLPEARRARPLALLRQIEHDLLHRAAYVTTTSQALARALHERYGGRPPAVIANAPSLQPDPRHGPPGKPPSLFWFSQTLGPGRGLEQFLDWWTRTTEPSRLCLLGEPDRGFAPSLLARMPPPRRDSIEFLPFVPPADLPALIARHDLGLALERRDIRSRDLTITNKILQYLNAGLAVVASDTAGHREVLSHEPEAGIIVPGGDPERGASDLDRLLREPARIASSQLAARRLAEATYCWERQAPRLLELVSAALGPRTCP